MAETKEAEVLRIRQLRLKRCSAGLFDPSPLTAREAAELRALVKKTQYADEIPDLDADEEKEPTSNEDPDALVDDWPDEVRVLFEEAANLVEDGTLDPSVVGNYLQDVIASSWEEYGSQWESSVVAAYVEGLEAGYEEAEGSGKGFAVFLNQFVANAAKTPPRDAWGQFMPAKANEISERLAEGWKQAAGAVSQSIATVITNGLDEGLSANEIADNIRALSKDIPTHRAYALARTEMTRAHAEGQLDAFGRLGVPDVTLNMEAELVTQGKNVCPECLALSKAGPMPLEKAWGVIPVHVNCKCKWKLTQGKDAVTGNVYCPNGPGGGIDPGCKVGGAPGPNARPGSGKKSEVAPSSSPGATAPAKFDGDVKKTQAFETHLNNALPGGVRQDMYLHDLFNEIGYGGKPGQASKAEMDKLVSQGWTEMYRGAPHDHQEQLRNGDIFVGKGVYGAGIYAGTGEKAMTIAQGYSGGDNRHVVRMALHPSAKVVTIKEVEDGQDKLSDTMRAKEKQQSTETKATQERIAADMMKAVQSGDTEAVQRLTQEYSAVTNRPKAERQLLTSDESRYAVTQGADAVYVEKEGYMVVLNRSALVIQEGRL